MSERNIVNKVTHSSVRILETNFEINNRIVKQTSLVTQALLITWCVQVLRSPKEAFAAAMQSWRERCEKCVCLQDDYVEK